MAKRPIRLSCSKTKRHFVPINLTQINKIVVCIEERWVPIIESANMFSAGRLHTLVNNLDYVCELDDTMWGDPIDGSRLVRGFCINCLEPIRMCRRYPCPSVRSHLDMFVNEHAFTLEEAVQATSWVFMTRFLYMHRVARGAVCEDCCHGRRKYLRHFARLSIHQYLARKKLGREDMFERVAAQATFFG